MAAKGKDSRYLQHRRRFFHIDVCKKWSIDRFSPLGKDTRTVLNARQQTTTGNKKLHHHHDIIITLKIDTQATNNELIPAKAQNTIQFEHGRVQVISIETEKLLNKSWNSVVFCLFPCAVVLWMDKIALSWTFLSFLLWYRH